MQRGIPTLSLFSGAGGLDIGFARAGYDIRACVEIEQAYAKTLCANSESDDGVIAGATIHCIDIRDFDPSPYVGAGIRCIIGGPPCQTFSAAGRRSGGVIGVDDSRGQLFRAYCDILGQVQPDVFVFENVYGLPGANGGKPWREIITAFAAVGYELRAEVLDSADYGVPQHRERLIMVGTKSGAFDFPLPTHGPDSAEGKPLRSVEDAIGDLQRLDEPYHNGLGGLYGHLLPEVPEGLNYAYFTAEMGHPNPAFAWRSKFHDLLYKVKRDEPCRTIKAQPGKFTGPFHWKNRHFTIPELKRLQSFPDGYELIGSYGKAVQQIGNSVPPDLAHVIATSVREQLLEPARDFTFPRRSSSFQSTFRQRQRERSKRFKEIARKATIGMSRRRPSQLSAVGLVDHYLLSPSNAFDRRRLAPETRVDGGGPIYSVKVLEDESCLDVHFVRVGAEREAPASTISIRGLRRYLGSFDACSVMAQVTDLQDVFHCWAAVEQALVSRSEFFSLIDIYGHYANKGDAVTIEADWRFAGEVVASTMLNAFSSTAACGDFVSVPHLLDALHVEEDQLRAMIAELRDSRFDVRSARTHPIIGDGRVLCTYPFPLLSAKALVESRAKIRQVPAETLARQAVG